MSNEENITTDNLMMDAPSKHEKGGSSKPDFAVGIEDGFDDDLDLKGELQPGVFTINPNPETQKEKMIAYGKLVLLAMPWIGIQCIWAAEFGTTTPYLQAMGLSEQWASNIWLSGPLMGFFVAPIVGSLSDKCHLKFGRRRPYMLGGLLLLGVVSTTLACSKYFGDAGLPVSCNVYFIIMDGTINVIQTPLRALIADFAPPEQQATGQLMASTFQGLGGLVGYFLQKFLWTDPLEILALFMVVFAINVIFVGLTCWFVKEQHFPAKAGEKGGIAEPFIHLFKSVKGLTLKLFIVGACVFFCWWALFSWWPTSSTWYMTIVMNGCCDDPSADGYVGECTPESYNDCLTGQSVNADVNILANVAQTCIGLLLAILMNYRILVRTRFVWSALLFFGAVLLIGSKFIKGEWYAYLVGIGMAVPISGIQAFPFAIVGKYNRDDEKE
eukprot:Awhi_evm1s13303